LWVMSSVYFAAICLWRTFDPDAVEDSSRDR
jgi:hypothetical protein